MQAQQGASLFNLIEATLHVFSEERCAVLMDRIIQVFKEQAPIMQERLKCVDNICSNENTYCMNTIIF